MYSKSTGVEDQIVRRLHQHCEMRFGLSPRDCDEFHHKYGSTIAGLKREQKISRSQEEDFYKAVYSGVDLSELLQQNLRRSRTGFHHHYDWRSLLRTLPGPLCVASNSPRAHVDRVLGALGLLDVQWASIQTPDSCEGWTKAEPQYWQQLLHGFPEHELCLLDDSSRNLSAASELGIPGVLVEDEGLERALAVALAVVPPDFVFDAKTYLRAKALQDAKARSADVWTELQHRVAKLAPPPDGVLRIHDLGAGLLSMLPQLTQLRGAFERLHVTAVEPQAAALEVEQQLKTLGFVQAAADVDVWRRGHCEVSLERRELFALPRPAHPVHLFVGCCFADLVPPAALTSQLLWLDRGGGALVYLPITFAGSTEVVPSICAAEDSQVFAAYHAALKQVHGHSLEPDDLVAQLRAHGAALLSRAASDWRVEPANEDELWQSLLYFVGLSTLSTFPPARLASWIRKCRQAQPTIVARNEDLLFQLPATSCAGVGRSFDVAATAAQDQSQEASKGSAHLLEFVGERKVQIRSQELPTPSGSQLLLRTEASLVSAGTELKLFRGDFEDGAAADVNFRPGDVLRYPMHYGYCLVGHVLAAGPEAALRPGDRAFAFSPHGSHALVDSAMAVPPAVATADALYLPNMETALALVQDAAPLFGDRVAVVGQGAVGLLVTALLSRAWAVTAIEPSAQRREVARLFGAAHVAEPREAASLAPFDVVVEVSGHASGLQLALDCCAYAGQVVLGSWYGDKPLELRLGLGFHRSGVNLRASQVSRVPGRVADRWSKERRLEEAWRLVQELKPSEVLTTLRLPAEEAQRGYEQLDSRQELGVEFSYTHH